MRAPFEIDPAHSMTDYLIRLENTLHDRAYLHDNEMYFVVDNYILFCLFLKDSQNLESFCAEKIYRNADLRFVVLPESLWELRRNIEETAKAFSSRAQLRQSLDSFLKEPLLQEFLKLMKERDRADQWQAIIEVLVRMMNDAKQRSIILAVHEFGRIRDFANPLNKLADDVSSGKVCTLMKLAQAFGVPELQIREADRLGAYRLLNRFRGRHHSDVVDALVYAKVKYLNEVASGSRDGRACRFFSHESMIDMLEQSIPKVGHRYVRSLTDSFLLLEDEGIGADDIQNMLASLQRARDGAQTRRSDRSGLVIESYKVASELRSIRERILHGHHFSKNRRSEDLHSLLHVEAERFARNLEELSREKRSAEGIAEEYRTQIEDLYRAINNFRNAEATLDEFMEPLEKAAWNLWEAIDGDKGQVEDLIIQCIAIAKPTDDISIYLEDTRKHDLDARRLSERIRGEVLPQAAPDLWPKLSSFVMALSEMIPRHHRVEASPIPSWRGEVEILVRKLAKEGVVALEQLESLLGERGDEARAYCRELIEKALEQEGANEIYTQALLRITQVPES